MRVRRRRGRGRGRERERASPRARVGSRAAPLAGARAARGGRGWSAIPRRSLTPPESCAHARAVVSEATARAAPTLRPGIARADVREFP